MTVEGFVTQICSFLVQLLAKIIPYLAVVSMTVNLFHLLILTRKTVTSSSMNTLLIGIAIVDILSPMVYVKRGLERILDNWQDFCQMPTYNEVLVDLILGSMSENFRRCSTWLGLLLAVTRTISVKFAVGRRSKLLTESRFGVYLIIGALSCSFPITIPYLIRYQVVQTDPHYCQYANGQIDLVVKYSIQEFWKNKTVVIGGSARAVHILLTGIFGQLIPSILFPIFASILICELRKPEKKNSKTVKTDKISKMVVYMTITFLFVEFPIGVGKIFNSMQTESTIPHDTNQIFHMLYVFPMTLMHCFICLTMSSQYQKTCRILLCLERKNSQKLSSYGNPSTMVTTTRH